MKSKTFYSKFAKASFIKQLWAMGLTAFAYFMTMTVPLAIMLNNWDANYELKYAQQEFEHYMLQADSAYVMLVIVGVFLAFVQFSYLHSNRQMDFYGSFPIRKETLFTEKCIFAYLDFVIPYTVVLTISVLIGMTKHLVSADLLIYMLEIWLINQIGFFLIFLTVALAIILTGRRWVGLLGSVVLLGFAYFVQVLFDSAAEYFFDTHYGVDQMSWMNYGSPVCLLYYMRELIFDLEERNILISGEFVWFVIVLAVVSVALFIVNRYLVRIRQAEKAGQSMAFKLPSRIIHIVLSAFGGIGIGMITMSFVSVNDVAWFLMGTVFGTACLYVLIQFIYTLDIRRTFTYKWQIIAAEAAAVLFCVIYSFDLIGYDNYLPAQDKLESVAICYRDENMYSSYYIDGEYIEALDYALENMELEPDDRTYSMLEEAVNGTDEYWNSDGQPYDEDAVLERIYVSYHLKSGRTVERMYMVPLSEYKENFIRYCEDEEYRKLLIPSLMLEQLGENVGYESLNLYYGGEEGTIYDAVDESGNSYEKEMADFVAVYNQDMKRLDSSVLVEKLPVAKLFIMYEMNDYYSRLELPVYAECTGTLALLKQMGHDPLTVMDVENIQKIEIDVYTPIYDDISSDGAASADYTVQEIVAEAGGVQTKQAVAVAEEMKTLEFTEQEEIIQILEYMVDDYFKTVWTETETNYYIRVYMKNTTYEVCCYGDFLKGHIPALVLEQ